MLRHLALGLALCSALSYAQDAVAAPTTENPMMTGLIIPDEEKHMTGLIIPEEFKTDDKHFTGLIIPDELKDTVFNGELPITTGSGGQVVAPDGSAANPFHTGKIVLPTIPLDVAASTLPFTTGKINFNIISQATNTATKSLIDLISPLPFQGTFEDNRNLKAEMLYSILPDQFKIFNLHRVFTAWAATPAANRAAFATLGSAFGQKPDLSTLLKGIYTVNPNLYNEIKTFLSLATSTYSQFKSPEAQAFAQQLDVFGQKILVSLLTDTADWSGLPIADITTAFGKLPATALIEFQTRLPQFTISIAEASAQISFKPENRPFLIYSHLPFVLQVEPIRSLLKAIWMLTPLQRAQIAARVGLLTSYYASFEQLVTDTKEISPDVAAAITTVGAYYDAQLAGINADKTSIGSFHASLAGSLLHLLQGEVHFDSSDAVTNMVNILQTTASADVTILSELMYIQLPEFMKVLNMHQLFQAWGQVTVDVRTQLSGAVELYRTNGDFDAFIESVGKLAPGLLVQYRLFVSEYQLAISRVTNPDAVNFLTTVVSTTRQLITGLVAGGMDLSFLSTTPVVLAYKQLSVDAKSSITLALPKIARSFDDTVSVLTGQTTSTNTTITVDINSQASIVYSNLPTVLQVAPMQEFLIQFWKLPAIRRAQLAATFTLNYGYTGLDQIVNDTRVLSVDLATAVENLGKYYLTTLTEKKVPDVFIKKFIFDFAGSMIPVIGGDVSFSTTELIDKMTYIMVNGATLVPTIHDVTNDTTIIAQFYYNELPDFLKAFNTRQIFTAWGALNVEARTAITTAITQFKTSNDFNAFIVSIQESAPSVAVQLKVLVDGFKHTIATVESVELQTFTQKMLDTTQNIFINIIEGKKETITELSTKIVTDFSALSETVRQEMTLILPTVTIAIQDATKITTDTTTTTVTKREVVYKNLPTILQVPTIENVVNILWNQTDVIRAQIAAKLAFSTAYTSFDNLVTDIEIISPDISAALEQVQAYFVSTLIGKSVNSIDIDQFRTSLAGALLQILQGQIYYQPTNIISTMTTIISTDIGSDSSIIVGQNIFDSLPAFLQVYNMRDLVTAWSVTPVVVQQAINHAVVVYKRTSDFEAFKLTIQMIAPELATQLNLLLTSFNEKITTVTDTTVTTFVSQLIQSTQTVVIGLFSGVSDFSFIPTSALVLAYQKLPATVIQTFNATFPEIITSFDVEVKELIVNINITAQPTVVFGRLPVVLQVPSVQNLINVYWNLDPLVRATIATQFAFGHSYTDFDKFIADIQVKSADVSAALVKVREYYLTLLKNNGNDAAAIQTFQTNLISSLFPIIRGMNSFDSITTTTDTLINIIGILPSPPVVNVTLNFGKNEWFFKFFNAQTILSTWQSVTPVVRQSINFAVNAFKISSDFDVLLEALTISSPDLAAVYQKIVDDYLVKISAVNDDLDLFIDQVTERSQALFVAILTGQTDFTGFITDDFITAFGTMADENRKQIVTIAPDLGTGFQQAFTIIINNSITINSDRINSIFNELPSFMRVSQVQNVISVIYQLDAKLRAQLIAHFAGAAYTDFAKFVLEVRAISPEVADALDATWLYFKTTLTATNSDAKAITSFQIYLTGQLLQIVQGGVHFGSATIQFVDLMRIVNGFSNSQALLHPPVVKPVIVKPNINGGKGKKPAINIKIGHGKIVRNLHRRVHKAQKVLKIDVKGKKPAGKPKNVPQKGKDNNKGKGKGKN